MDRMLVVVFDDQAKVHEGKNRFCNWIVTVVSASIVTRWL